MSREDAIQVEGKVVEVLRDTVFRVELSNRHQLLAHVASNARQRFPRLAPGDTVTVRVSPYDLSKGWISLENRTIES